MASITLKNIPTKLHRLFKQRAKQNRRSLNSEILDCLQLTANIQKMEKIDTDKILERAEKIRRQLNFTVTEEEITEFKNQGRL